MKKKRVLIVSQYFYPESFRINELAFELAKGEYQVDVLTAIPNYPQGNYFKGFGVFKKRKEVINNCTIYRCFHFPRFKNPTGFTLALNYLSFLLTATLRVLFQFVWLKKYDAIIGFQLSPITQVIPGCLLGKLRGVKVLTWVQDIWPDSIIDSPSEKKRKLILPLLTPFSEYVYKNSDKLLISSPCMKELICRKKDYSSKIEWVPNWCDDFLKENTIPSSLMPQGFNIVMGGSINEGIGIDGIIKLIEEFEGYPDINFVFIGGGSRKEYLERYVNEHHLNNTFILGLFPYEQMPSFYASADATLLSLAKSELKYLDITIPSRLQSYMSAGKPVFAMIGSGAQDIIEAAQCGFVASPGDYKKLASIIKNNYKNKELLKQYGKNARNYFLKQFTVQTGIKHFENLITA